MKGRIIRLRTLSKLQQWADSNLMMISKDNHEVLHLGWDNPTRALGLSGCGAALQDGTWESCETRLTLISNMLLWQWESPTYMHYRI